MDELEGGCAGCLGGCSGREYGGVVRVAGRFAARVVIRAVGGVGGKRVHSEQRHGPRWVNWRSLGARHLEWTARRPLWKPFIKKNKIKVFHLGRATQVGNGGGANY